VGHLDAQRKNAFKMKPKATAAGLVRLSVFVDNRYSVDLRFFFWFLQRLLRYGQLPGFAAGFGSGTEAPLRGVTFWVVVEQRNSIKRL
jgi:hypothetical protein